MHTLVNKIELHILSSAPVQGSFFPAAFLEEETSPVFSYAKEASTCRVDDAGGSPNHEVDSGVASLDYELEFYQILSLSHAQLASSIEMRLHKLPPIDLVQHPFGLISLQKGRSTR